MSCCNRQMTHWTETLNLTIKFRLLLILINYIMTKMTEQTKNWEESHDVRDDFHHISSTQATRHTRRR